MTKIPKNGAMIAPTTLTKPTIPILLMTDNQSAPTVKRIIQYCLLAYRCRLILTAQSIL
ncbi:hypothetical protein [uncultured Psychrobacter sp.]|uniref:hypothetical protein n=1 Tax=Psychrobacter sp. Ps3 TaxID=2790957 RepID=UPI001EE00E35|nr:hypothetical protein [uncultured Psychrobacter sp.]